MAKVEIFAPFMLSWEGGYVNHPKDPGSHTNRGVTISTWKAQGYDKDGDGDIDVDDLKLINDADATMILKKNYWNRWKADEIKSQSVANLLVDWVWASGAYGIKIPQQLLGVTADGVVGPKTLAALNSRDPKTLFSQIFARREKFIRSCKNFNVFGNGWLNRLNSIGNGWLDYNAFVVKDGKKVRKRVTFNP